MELDNKPTILLWTGGYDSTFRLLQLLIDLKRPVRPIYLMDTERTSTHCEIAAMRAVKKWIYRNSGEARDLLLPVCIYDRLDFPASQSLKQAIHTVRKEKRANLGMQYSWLASFADATCLRDVELSIHADDQAHYVLQDVVETALAGENSSILLRKSAAKTDSSLFRLFHRFRFPVFELTKLDTLKAAKASCYADALNDTWFCHAPRRGKPCGTCNPCVYTIQEGFPSRVPLAGRIRYNLKQAAVKFGCYRAVSQGSDFLRNAGI